MYRREQGGMSLGDYTDLVAAYERMIEDATDDCLELKTQWKRGRFDVDFIECCIYTLTNQEMLIDKIREILIRLHKKLERENQ